MFTFRQNGYLAAVNRRVLVSSVLSMCALAGCGGSDRPETVPVTGKVTVSGQPVAGASVEFHPAGEGGRHAHAVTQADGTFELTTFAPGDGAVPGTYDVAIAKKAVKEGVDVKTLTPGGPENTGNQAYEQMMIRPSGPAAVDTGAVPQKYADPKKSELRRTVDPAGGNEFVFDL